MLLYKSVEAPYEARRLKSQPVLANLRIHIQSVTLSNVM